ncbi:MAG TPA: RidA family protein [Thermoleophilaceae bacterium]|nr:RidA family protein [Thermoleophilaceae bacterium]
MSSPHELVNPSSLAEPAGFSHAVVPAAGRTVYLGGQAGHDSEGRVVAPGIVEQVDQAAANVVEALAAAGGLPEHIVSVQIFVTDVAEYRGAARKLGEVWRARFGRHYPALALFGVTSLFDPEAKVELVAVAVVPDGR